MSKIAKEINYNNAEGYDSQCNDAWPSFEEQLNDPRTRHGQNKVKSQHMKFRKKVSNIRRGKQASDLVKDTLSWDSERH